MTQPHPHPVVRRAGTAAAVLALSVTLAGCGGGSDDGAGAAASGSPSASGDPGGASDSAGQQPTSTATTATPEASAGPAGPTPVSAAQLSGIVDDALDDTSGAHLVVDNTLGFLSGEGDIDLRETPSSLAMTLTSSETGDGQPVVVQVIGSSLYLQADAGWLQVDIDSPQNPFGRSFTDQLDPRTVLDVVEREQTRAVERGTVEQDGDTLTVYRITADGPAVAQALAPELASQADVAVPTAVACDLTVDPDGHARTITLGLGADNGTLTYTLTDWRTDISVQAPPASEVSQLPDLG